MISQFGLMFFDDPVRAFTNIRHALTTNGRAAFVCWQGLHANEWLMLIADAVRRHADRYEEVVGIPLRAAAWVVTAQA